MELSAELKNNSKVCTIQCLFLTSLLNEFRALLKNKKQKNRMVKEKSEGWETYYVHTILHTMYVK